METVIERLLHEEQKFKDRGNATGGASSEEVMTTRHRRQGPICHYCRKVGHIKRNCRDFKRARGSPNNLQHQSKTPPHKINSVLTKGPDDSTDSEVGLVANHVLTHTKESNEEWIVDSGATSHICKDRILFTRLYPLNCPVEVKLGDGHILTATAQGSVRLKLKCGDSRFRKCILHDVLYVPQLSYNLLSVCKAAERGNAVRILSKN